MTSNEMSLIASIAVDMQKNEVDEVLDKIREEIRIASMIEIDGDSYVRLKNVYEIFDWYTKESEDI